MTGREMKSSIESMESRLEIRVLGSSQVNNTNSTNNQLEHSMH